MTDWLHCPDEEKRQRIVREMEARHALLNPKLAPHEPWYRVLRVRHRPGDAAPLVRWTGARM